MKSYTTAARIVILVLCLVLFIAIMLDFIKPVVLGLLISLVARPVYKWLYSKFAERPHLAAATCTILVTICVLLPLILLGVFVVKDAWSLVNTLNDVSKRTADGSSSLSSVPALNHLYAFVNRIHPVSEQEFAERLRAGVAVAGASVADRLRAIAASVPRKTISVVFFLIAFYFGLLDGPQLVQFLREHLPFSNREINELFSTIQRMCNAVVLGAVMAGVVQGIIMGLTYWVLGIPRAWLFGALTTIFSLVPLVGTAPTGIGGILYLLVQGRPAATIVMAIGFLLASLSDNVVKPWVLKGKMELHPLLGLLSVLGGLRLFGISGLFLGPIITVLTLAIFHLVRHRLKTQEGATGPAQSGA